MLNGLDLFSGIGGLTLGLSEWVRPIAYCESDPYCQAQLLSRMQTGQLPMAPIWDDIRTFSACYLSPCFIDIIYGGFPCQDISVAGHGKGLGGDRSCLYWEIHRVAKEIKPVFIFLENVPAICSRGGWEIVSSLAEIGYDCRWCVLSAQECGAPHKRNRWWLLAHSESIPLQQNDSSSMQIREREKTWNITERKTLSIISKLYWEKNKPPICGMDNGIPLAVDRIRALGNSVVPQCAKKAFEYLMGLDKVQKVANQMEMFE